MRALLLAPLLYFTVAGQAPVLKPDTGLLPPDGFLQAWKKAEAPRVFTAGDLYGHIDGGAEIFLEFGFEQLTVQSYARSGGAAKVATEEFKVEVYRMSDPIAATGIYLMNCGKESPNASFAVRHSLNPFQLIFQRNRYYVIVNNSEGNEKLAPAMVEFGRYISDRLPSEVPVKLGELLPPKGLDRSSIRLIRGPYALQAVFTLGTGDVLQLGRKLTAVSGNYRDATGSYSLVLVDYPDEQAALQALINVQSRLDTYLKVEEKTGRRLVFKDYSNQYGVISVVGKRLTVQLHLANKPFSGK